MVILHNLCVGGLFMNTLEVLFAHPGLFFRLSGIRLEDFDKLVKSVHPLWLIAKPIITDRREQFYPDK